MNGNGGRKISGLYYITHVNNLESILRYGVLSHLEVERRGIKYHKIYNEEIVNRRKDINTPSGKSLWDYANVYFQPRNPMLYQVAFGAGQSNPIDIVIVSIRKDLLLEMKDILLSTGNAARHESKIVPFSIQALKEIGRSINIVYWHEEDGTKRKIMAECLVPNSIPPRFIDCIYVPRTHDDQTKARVQDIVKRAGLDIAVIQEPYMFFQPESFVGLTANTSLAAGDMFFSRMQTLTVSVNTVGVMGKGLASRAKYQFPDVYVRYQDLCKRRILQVGKPFLIPRETSLISDLAENSIENNQATWFILFPTKRHWREDSDIEYIVDGLKWITDHYKAWQLKSLALPALGCGLGKLDWKDVGPLICSAASRLDIRVTIYLPTEVRVPEEYLRREYLIR